MANGIHDGKIAVILANHGWGPAGDGQGKEGKRMRQKVGRTVRGSDGWPAVRAAGWPSGSRNTARVFLWRLGAARGVSRARWIKVLTNKASGSIYIKLWMGFGDLGIKIELYWDWVSCVQLG